MVTPLPFPSFDSRALGVTIGARMEPAMPAFYATTASVTMLTDMARAEYSDARRHLRDCHAHARYAEMMRAAGLESLAVARDKMSVSARASYEMHNERCLLLCQALRNLGQNIRLA